MPHTRREFFAVSAALAAGAAGAAPQPPDPMDTLLALAETLTGLTLNPASDDTAHFAEMLRWRSDNVDGAKATYAAAATRIDAAARARFDKSFVACDDAQRWTIVRPAQEEGASATVCRELRGCYARTNVWTALGYADWPGHPRGLEAYRRPIAHVG